MRKKQATDIKSVFKRGMAILRTGAPCLVVVMRPFSIQGLVVRRESGSIRILRFATAEFESTVRSPRVRMARIMEKLGAQKFSRIIIVTPEASSFVVDLPWKGKKAMRSGDKLDRLALWEVSSFLEYPPEQALVRTVPLPEEPDEDEFFTSYSDEEGQENRRAVLVSVFSSRVYGALVRLCEGYKKKLIAVAPEEIFAMTARFLAGPQCQCVMVDCRMHDIVCVLMDQGMPRGMIRGSVEAGEIYGEAVIRTLEILRPPPEVRVYLSGDRAVECRESMHGNEIRSLPWTVLDEINGPDGSWGPLPGSYAAALGAAVDQGLMLINDRVALGTRLRRNIFILPLVLLLLLILGMGGAYGFLRAKTETVRQDISEYSKEKKRLEGILSKDAQVREKLSGMERSLLRYQDTSEYLRTGLPIRNTELLGFLAEATRSVPQEVTLERVYQTADDLWYMRGMSRGLAPIMRFQAALDGIAGVRSVTRETVKPVNTPGAVTHGFEISIRLGGKDGS